MISFTFETQRSVYWTFVTWSFVLLAALCCCNGVVHQKTVKTVEPLRSASESSRMPDTTKQPETAALDLGALLDAGDGAVVTLVARDTRLAAHRTVLAVGSPVFAAMFHPETLEASSSEVAIPDVEGPVLRQLVAFLYTGRAPQQPGMALQLLAVAEKYGVRALKDASEQQVTKRLDVESAAATAVMAVRHSWHPLRKAAIAFIKAHIFEVLATHGWAEAVLNHPDDVVQIYHLLAEPLAKTNTIAIAHSMPTATAASAAGVASTTATRTTVESRSIPTAAPTSLTAMAQHNSSYSRSAATPQLPTAGCHTPPLDAAAVSHLRSLSAKEKGRRLLKAAKEGSVQELRALLAAGADPQVADEGDNTALDMAAYYGHFEATLCLLLAGAQVEASDSRLLTPLHDAVISGQTCVVRLLLAANADPNARDHEGRTPLHLAALGGRSVEAAALLQARANMGAKDMYGQTALDLARSNNNQQLIRVLQSHPTNN